MGAQNSAGAGTAVEGLGEGANDKFKVVKQMRDASRPSLKNLAPASKTIREMGAKFDLGSKIGMTQVNTAESTKIQTGPEIGKGGLVNEVF
jgi:hypothetical protein